MKTINYHLISAAAVVLLGATFSVQAVETIQSPRAKANQIRVVPSIASAMDVNLVTNRPFGNAKAWALAKDLRKVSGAGSGIDLAGGPRPLLSPKDPRYQQALREMRHQEFYIAPLK